MEKIYVIEDEDNIRDLIRITLTGYGYTVITFENAEEALEKIQSDMPNLAIFDLMLPGINGLEAIKKIRGDYDMSNLPVLILTARDGELDKVTGLDSGADDYMTKPFSILELSARVRSLLRRNRKAGQEENSHSISIGDVKLDKNTRDVYKGGEKIILTLKEFELLAYLMENSSRVVPRAELLNKIWGYNYEGETRTLDMHIRTLRQKTGDNDGKIIHTVRGVGYRYIVTED